MPTPGQINKVHQWWDVMIGLICVINSLLDQSTLPGGRGSICNEVMTRVSQRIGGEGRAGYRKGEGVMRYQEGSV